jgi:adenylosuccinate synthase
VVLKYSNSINGYDLLNLTKLDVLDGLDEIKVATKYKLGDQELEGFPGMRSSYGSELTDALHP